LVISLRHAYFINAPLVPEMGGRRCGWGRPSIRLFSVGLGCPARSATQLGRAPGTVALFTLTTTKLSVGGMLVIRDRARFSCCRVRLKAAVDKLSIALAVTYENASQPRALDALTWDKAI